jgi:CRISPR-associated protein Csx17
MNIHDLNGCAPAPLALYLKALGILRLVSEQSDPTARGWWEGERFRLATKLDREELEKFFLDQYKPTPIFNPWGGRSGFYPDSSEKRARQRLRAIEHSEDQRFGGYQAAIKVVRDTIESICSGVKPTDDDKDNLILALRRSVRGKSTLWLDTVASVVGVGNSLEIKDAALFGTGGNEGSGSYTSAYMAAIEECLLKRLWNQAMPMVLFGENNVPGCNWGQSMGQFLPDCPGTPWDLLLAFEGACTVRSAVSSRNTTNSTKWMTSPFFVAPTSYGYASEARSDEYALKNGKELPGRGEQWFPLWPQPMLFSEINQIFVEGRAVTKKGRATDGWSMVRAITSLGTRQGVNEFIRYGYQQRNNQATHFAVPLGRFRVPEQSSLKLACLDDLDAWLYVLRRQARSKEASARLRLVERRLSDALFAVTQHPDEARRWQEVLVGMADVEAVLRTGSGHKAGPVPRLRPEWVTAADDGTPEFRLALACALQLDPVRRHWLPLGKPGRFATADSGGKSLQTGPEVIMQGRDGVSDAIALVSRRLLEAAQRGERRLPLTPAYRAVSTPPDLADLVAGSVDLNRTLALARALMALDGRRWAANPCPSQRSKDRRSPDDAWLIIRLALLPWPLPDGRKIGVDPAIVRRLASGDATTATELALRRLRAAGINATVRVAAVPPATARLWAAALAFPIDKKVAAEFVRRLEPTTQP